MLGHITVEFIACKFGSDEKGWQDKLALQVNMGDGTFRALFLEDGDFYKTKEELVANCLEALFAPGSTQESKQLGIFRQE